MGKKAKIGKQRKDRFYHLAKETGYRSRAAFKLIQLNRKFEFLQQSKVLIDLCAAPGGWLQVAQKYMPVQSVILGIDLAPIKPIFNVTTLQEDITTQKCRTFITKELKTWKADCVLHDGAPNVGKSWIHDAFEQNRLTLSALHLACDFLMKGGWFVTKVFRSKDYNALMWVFKKLFKRVHATKPQASRNESAEIFVVCQGFLAPDRIDPKFFDSTSVFADVKGKEVAMTKGDLLKAITNPKKSKAEGYEDSGTVYRKLNASDFLVSKDYVDLMSKANEIVLDRKDVREHPSTTFEIKECIKDLKVLGKKELNLLFNWRTTVRNDLKKAAKTENNEEQFLSDDGDDNDVEEIEEHHGKSVKIKTKEGKKSSKDDDEDEDDDDESMDDEENDEEAKKLKRKKRKIAKEKRKLEERLSLKMIIKDDQLIEEDYDLFNMNDIRRRAAKTMMNDDVQGELLSDEEVEEKLPRIIKRTFDKDSSERYYDPDDSDAEIELDDADDEDRPLDFEDDDSDDENAGKGKNDDQNEMIVDFDSREDRNKEATRRFFENKVFQSSTGGKKDGVLSFLDDDDNDLELKEIQNRIAKAKRIQERKNGSKKDENDNEVDIKDDDGDDNDKNDKDDSMSRFDGDDDLNDDDGEESSDDDDDEDAGKKGRGKRASKVLTPEEMALGAMLIKSKKAKREMMDHGWNRYVHEDDELMPSWFRKEEGQYFRKQTPVTGEMVKEYNQKLKEINSKPIKKVLEAKARKKKRALRRLEKARNKAETITEDSDMTNTEKAQYIRSIYKKAVKKNQDKVQLVVGKKQYGKSRPPGVKGRYKIVDSRLKKDKRAAINKEKTKGRGKKGVKPARKRPSKERKKNRT